MTDFRIVDGQNYDDKTLTVIAGTTASINPGQIVVLDAGNAGYIALAADGANSAGTTVGVATSLSTETATDDGTVRVAVKAGASLEVEARVTTPANLARALVGTKVTLDVAAGVQTVDENDAVTGMITILESPDRSFDTTNGVHRFLVPCGL